MMSSPTNNLQSLIYSNTAKGDDDNASASASASASPKPTLSVLDQLLIPDKKEYIPIPNVEAAWSVIRTMQIRGAPLIAIVACLGLAVDLATYPPTIQEIEKCTSTNANANESLVKLIERKMEYLRTSRPTAVNLFNAMEELGAAISKEAASPSSTTQSLIQAVITHAEFMLQRDVEDNQAIGMNGAKLLLSNTTKKQVRIVTICNTGSLATAGYGTALGVARALHSQDQLKSIHALETRPYNQGSRLTAFEIMEEQMPNGTLICDSAAAALMRTSSASKGGEEDDGGIDACVVGADRVCANGDTANKIGTYQLAVVAKTHNVPFYVAAPFTTLDTKLPHGDCIEIEERPAEEMIDTSRAPKNMVCWNPAFDVTPASFITGIITEKGVITEKNEDGSLDVTGFVAKHS